MPDGSNKNNFHMLVFNVFFFINVFEELMKRSFHISVRRQKHTHKHILFPLRPNPLYCLMGTTHHHTYGICVNLNPFFYKKRRETNPVGWLADSVEMNSGLRVCDIDRSSHTQTDVKETSYLWRKCNHRRKQRRTLSATNTTLEIIEWKQNRGSM